MHVTRTAVAIGVVVALAFGRLSGQTSPTPTVDLAGQILTVRGPIAPAALGQTIMHEHVFIDLNAPGEDPERWRWSTAPSQMGVTAFDLYRRPFTIEIAQQVRSGMQNRDASLLLDEETAIAEVREFARHGGRTIVDVTNIGLRRDPEALRRVAEATGLQIVMGASWYQKAFHPPDMDTRTLDSLTDEIVRDVTVGVGTTGIRAGIIGEVGTAGNPLTPNEIKVLRASARASRLTGAAISIHVAMDLREQPRILDILEQEGADLRRVILGHSANLATDIAFLKQLVARGVFIQFDTFGRIGYQIGHILGEDAGVARAILELIKSGYGDRVLVSQDVCRKFHLKKFGGTGYSYVLEQVVPYLRQLGATDAQVDDILVKNPQRALTLVKALPVSGTD